MAGIAALLIAMDLPTFARCSVTLRVVTQFWIHSNPSGRACQSPREHRGNDQPQGFELSRTSGAVSGTSAGRPEARVGPL